MNKRTSQTEKQSLPSSAYISLCVCVCVLPVAVSAVSVVLVSSWRIVGYAGWRRNSLRRTGSGGLTCLTHTKIRSQNIHTHKHTRSMLLLFNTVTLVTFFDAGSGSPAQNRNADWPDVVRTVEPSKARKGQTNSASHRLCP